MYKGNMDKNKVGDGNGREVGRVGGKRQRTVLKQQLKKRTESKEYRNIWISQNEASRTVLSRLKHAIFGSSFSFCIKFLHSRYIIIENTIHIWRIALSLKTIFKIKLSNLKVLFETHQICIDIWQTFPLGWVLGSIACMRRGLKVKHKKNTTFSKENKKKEMISWCYLTKLHFNRYFKCLNVRN